MAPHRFCFDRNCGEDDCNEEVLHWVLDQGGRGTRVLVIVTTGMKVVAMDIGMDSVQSAVNETTYEENK